METIMFYIKLITKMSALVFAVLYTLDIVGFESAVFMMLLAVVNNLEVKEAAE